ncbi:MAG: hypothetical protein HZB10_00150 [Candidatus Yonathbacteria bacterium]|nr:hypothetical protein [Candidatus Yonathbacteria bacterium]
MKNYERGELAKEILRGLALGGFIVMCLAMPNIAQVADLFKSRNSRDRYRVKQALRGLQKRNMVRIVNRGGQEVVEITTQGKKKILDYDLENMQLDTKRKWDGKWRIVMFDIPQTQKSARDAVSFKIKEIGMCPVQKSVFVFPHPCKDEIDFVGEVFGVRKNIIYIEATHIDGAEKARRHFGM